MRQWRGQDSGDPAARRRGSGAAWEDDGQRRGSGTAWEQPPRDDGPARSSRRNRQPSGFDHEVDLERALVPMQEQMPMATAGAGLPVLPGFPGTDDAERALGIRRPVYIPATHEKKVRPGTWRIASGVLSVLLFCVASCGLAGVLGHSKIESWLVGPVKSQLTPPSFDYSVVPATPTSTPGPDGKYVTNAVTARDEDSLHNPVGPTTSFTLPATVHLLAQVRGVPKGQQHKVWVRWYLNNVNVGLGRVIGSTVVVINQGDSNLHFSLNFKEPGIGMAKLYWDIPDSDSGDSPNDAYLARTVVFGLHVPTSSPTATPSATSTKAGADLGPAPVARYETTTSV